MKKKKTNRFWFYTFIVAGAAVMFSYGCKKEDPVELPVVTTAAVSEITETSASSGGNVTDDGGGTVTARGVVWSKAENPTIDGNSGITTDGQGPGQFTSTLLGLDVGATYYVRAYATNLAGTSYGSQVSFETLAPEDKYSLTLKAEPEAGGAVAGGGHYDEGENITVSSLAYEGYEFINWTDASGTEISTETEFEFTMPAEDVTLTANFDAVTYQLTLVADPATDGTVTGDGEYSAGQTVQIEATPAEGSAFVNWTDSDGNIVSSDASYEYTMPARDETLTANFSTPFTLTLVANPEEGGVVEGAGEFGAGAIITLTATANEGYVLENWTDELDNVVSGNATFDYTMPAENVTLTANFIVPESPDDGTTGTVTTADGTLHNTVWINGREWLAENLKTTKYSDGTDIPNVTDPALWPDLTEGAYAFYNNDPGYASSDGALYNFYTVEDERGLCPIGWHVPTSEEFSELEGYADTMFEIGDPMWENNGLRGHDAGKRLMATTGWVGNIGEDIYGFGLLPTGRVRGGVFSDDIYGYLWTADGRYRRIRNDRDVIGILTDPSIVGYAIRCVRD